MIKKNVATFVALVGQKYENIISKVLVFFWGKESVVWLKNEGAAFLYIWPGLHLFRQRKPSAHNKLSCINFLKQVDFTGSCICHCGGK